MIKLILISIACISEVYFLFGVIYLTTGFGRRFYHDILGWHQPDNGPQSFDGCSVHATCKYCGKEIMQDSQGNWF